MKSITLLFAIAFLPIATSARADIFQTGQAASVVLGQPDFTTNTVVHDEPNRFSNPSGVALDPTTGKVFISEEQHHRVLRFSSTAAAQNGSSPEAVFGQIDFSSQSPNRGDIPHPTAVTLCNPSSLCVDTQGRLWIVDSGNSRVLGFYGASFLGNGPSADIVLGQPNFTTGTVDTTAAKMGPSSVHVGSDDTLWVADRYNHRVLRFANVSAKSNGANADGVLGQPNFTTRTAATTANGMNSPEQVWTDAAGRLWVADGSNHRVLRFDSAVAKADADGASADGVLGQPDFTTNTSDVTASKFNHPKGVYLDGKGDVWVSDTSNNRVLRFPSSAASLPNGETAAANLVLGQSDFTTNAADATATTLNRPIQISPGPNGSLLVADLLNHRVLRFGPPSAAPFITRQGSAKRKTGTSKFQIKGFCGDSDGTVVAVRGRVNGAPSINARGISPWNYTAKLRRGKNRIEIHAIDNDGFRSNLIRVTIKRK